MRNENTATIRIMYHSSTLYNANEIHISLIVIVTALKCLSIRQIVVKFIILHFHFLRDAPTLTS